MTSATPRSRRRLGPRVTGAIGIVTVIAVWWILAETVFRNVGVSPTGEGGTIPNPGEVLWAVVEDGPALYARNAGMTLLEAAIGYGWGNLVAFALAALVVLVPRVDGVVSQLAIISYCIPIVAIGPIVRIVLGSPAPGTPSGTAVFLAALLVLFTTLIGTLLGLRQADRAALDVVAVYGGGRAQQFLRVQVIAALPNVLNALKIAAPSAFLGAIIGEYLGGVDLGIGPALVNAQQTLDVPRAWALALVTGLCSGLGFAIFALIQRFVTPWARGASGGGVS